MKETEKAWLAAMIDGEGCISIARMKPRWKLRSSAHYRGVLAIGNTCRALLERCVEITGVGRIHNMKRSENRKTCYHWQSANKQAADVLRQVHPYLIAKQRQADVVFQLDDINEYTGQTCTRERPCDSGTQHRREQLKRTIHALNKSGAVDGGDLTAPESVTANGRIWYFQYWLVDDDPRIATRPVSGPTDPNVQLLMDADHTLMAVYDWRLDGDNNGDCTVNVLDLLYVRNRLQTSCSAPGP